MTHVSLVQVASSMNRIINFIEGAEFVSALSAIADNDLNAAKLAMQNAGKAQDIKREVTLAVGHLQSAHTANRSIWKAYNSDLGKRTKALTLETAAQKDRYVSCLMALCYLYLREFSLAKNCVTFAKESHKAQDWFNRSSDGTQAIAIIGTLFREPGNVLSRAMNDKSPAPYVNVQAFSEAIEQYR